MGALSLVHQRTQLLEVHASPALLTPLLLLCYFQISNSCDSCPESGAAFLMGGPIWARPLHDQAWVAGLLQQMDQESGRYAQHARLKGILTSVLEELPDVPLYYK